MLCTPGQWGAISHLKFFDGVCQLVLQALVLFQTSIMYLNFRYTFPNPACKFHAKTHTIVLDFRPNWLRLAPIFRPKWFKNHSHWGKPPSSSPLPPPISSLLEFIYLWLKAHSPKRSQFKLKPTKFHVLSYGTFWKFSSSQLNICLFLFDSSSLREFCDEQSFGRLFWNSDVQDFCFNRWAHKHRWGKLVISNISICGTHFCSTYSRFPFFLHCQKCTW